MMQHNQQIYANDVFSFRKRMSHKFIQSIKQIIIIMIDFYQIIIIIQIFICYPLSSPNCVYEITMHRVE